LKKIKKILVYTFWIVIISGLLISVGFVNKQQDSLLCKDLDISINQKDDLFFIDNLEVTQILKVRGDSIKGQKKSTIDVAQIENILNNHPAVENSEVCVTIDGVVKIKIDQRKPIVRIFNLSGESYYIDDKAKLMPLSDNYTKNVLVVNGNINLPYAIYYKKNMNDTLVTKKTLLDDIYALAQFINKDSFWSAQIQQLYINQDKDIELVPLVGDQKIIFGDSTMMENKFYKLKLFYQEGLNKTDSWNKYSSINLKYKNQIVCTKKS